MPAYWICALTFSTSCSFNRAFITSSAASNFCSLLCSSRKALCSLRNSLSNIAFICLVAHAEGLAVLAAYNAIWVNLGDLLGDHAIRRRTDRSRFQAKARTAEQECG